MRTHSPRRWVAVAGLGAAALIGPGCAAGSEPDGMSTPSASATVPASRSPRPTPKPTPKPPDEPMPRFAAGMTRPGTTLRFGQQAVVGIQTYLDHGPGNQRAGVIGITVESIRSAPLSVLPPTVILDRELDEHRSRYRVYYAHVTVRNLGGTDLAGGLVLSVGELAGYDRDGDPGPVDYGYGLDFDGCLKPERAPDHFTSKGAAFETCVVEISTTRPPISLVRYDDGARYNEAEGRHITWT